MMSVSPATSLQLGKVGIPCDTVRVMNILEAQDFCYGTIRALEETTPYQGMAFSLRPLRSMRNGASSIFMRFFLLVTGEQRVRKVYLYPEHQDSMLISLLEAVRGDHQQFTFNIHEDDCIDVV